MAGSSSLWLVIRFHTVDYSFFSMNQWVWNWNHGDHQSWWFGPSRWNLIIHNWDLEMHISNLGTPRTQELSNCRNFLNSQHYQKLNVGECWRINYLKFMSQFSVLGVPRLSSVVFLSSFFPYCVIIRTVSRKKYDAQQCWKFFAVTH